MGGRLCLSPPPLRFSFGAVPALTHPRADDDLAPPNPRGPFHEAFRARGGRRPGARRRLRRRPGPGAAEIRDLGLRPRRARPAAAALRRPLLLPPTRLTCT